MRPTYAESPKTGIPRTRVNPTHDQQIAIQLLFEMSLAGRGREGELLGKHCSPYSRLRRVIGRIGGLYASTAQRRDFSFQSKPNEGALVSGSFPNDDAALKLLYVAIKNVGLRWRQGVAWRAAMGQFAIQFGARFPGSLADQKTQYQPSQNLLTQKIGHSRRSCTPLTMMMRCSSPTCIATNGFGLRTPAYMLPNGGPGGGVALPSCRPLANRRGVCQRPGAAGVDALQFARQHARPLRVDIPHRLVFRVGRRGGAATLLAPHRAPRGRLAHHTQV
jgi:putative transposase